MKFMKLDTPAPAATTKHPHKDDHNYSDDGYMYLDEMLDKTFMTDYFLH